jgi:hypothetical protein
VDSTAPSMSDVRGDSVRFFFESKRYQDASKTRYKSSSYLIRKFIAIPKAPDTKGPMLKLTIVHTFN